jgi:hypothetical protein
MIFLDEDLTQSQIANLKHSRELVATAQQAGKWVVIRNLRAIIRDSLPLAILGLGPLNEGLVGEVTRVRVSQ